MTSMGTSASTPFTVHDLEGMPDDGRRYELIDGELLVSPAPGLRHQTISYQLHRLLDDVCPDDMYVIAAPFAVQTDIANEVQPDVLVARFDDLTEKNLPTAPVLAVEVLSPSGRLIDLNLKRAAYERMGTPCYWVLDPSVPDLLVLELDVDGQYVEVARVAGDEPFETSRPFKVRVVPARLLGRLQT
ncbi:MAG TPA: Uma2 family endonuclease [Pseudonocardiaceae bacterium]|jgi:Uma2 family endonuclease|nr:Uma2 family endonuclease [Pseudonocardiaceae bacterium]